LRAVAGARPAPAQKQRRAVINESHHRRTKLSPGGRMGGRMHRITILTTHPGGPDFAPFEHGEASFVFEPLTALGPRRLIEGAAWAFIDWIVPELSGLELCRRLRADPRTVNAHVTMVLERDDMDDRRRALRAGA